LVPSLVPTSFTSSKMRLSPVSFVSVVFLLVGVEGATYRTSQQVVTPGRTFTCKYGITYEGSQLQMDKSWANCFPRKNAVDVTVEIYVPELDRVVSITHQIKKGKDPIISMEIIEPTQPPSAAAGSMSCQCRIPFSFPDGSFATSRMLVKGDSSISSTRSAGGLSRLLPSIGSSFISAFLGQALAASVDRAIMPKESNRQLLTGLMGGTGGSNDLVNSLVQQMVEQQVNDFLSNGGAEEALSNLVSSGQLQEAVVGLVESGQLQDSLTQLVDSEAIQEAVSAAAQEALASVAADENMPNLESLGLNGGLSDFGDQLSEMTLPEFDSTEFLNNLNLETMELNMNCDCAEAA